MSVEGIKDLQALRAWIQAREKNIGRLPETFFADRMESMEAKAKKKIDEVVYNVYENDPVTKYHRTFKTRDLVTVIPLIDQAGACVMIPDDPSLQTDITTGQDTIYPMLMLPGFSQNSYWPERTYSGHHPRATLPRDFLGAWLELFRVEAFHDLKQAIEEEISK